MFPGAEREAELGFDAGEAGGDFLAVGFGGVGVLRIPGFVLACEAGEFFAQKWKKLFCGARHEEKDARGDPLRTGFFGGGSEGFEFAIAIGDAGNQRRR